MSEKKMEDIQELAEKVLAQAAIAKAKLKKEYDEFLKKKEKFEKEQALSNSKYKITKKIIHLNVGGKYYTTKVSTLLKAQGTMIGAMFSGRYPPIVQDMDGRYVIDRPYEYFDKILYSLRTDSKLEIPEDDEERKNLLDEIKFYGMEDFYKEELREPEFIGGKLIDKKFESYLNGWIKVDNKNDWHCIFKATKDGFSSYAFHQKCNNKGPTVVVIKSTNGNIFGGYVPVSWISKNGYVYNNKTCLFSLVNSDKKPIKLPNTGPSAGTTYSFYDYSSYGPTFGGGHDLYICNNSNTTTGSYSNLGHSFTCPGYTYNTTQIKNFLAGSYNFKTVEIEVYALKKRG